MRVTADVRFTIIPEWVLFAPISPNAVRLYGVLARHTDKDQAFAIVGRSKLAHEMRCSDDTVDRALVELVNILALEVQNRTDPANPAHKLTNRYSLFTVPGGAGQGTGTDAHTPPRAITPLPTGTGAARVGAPVRQRTKASNESLERKKILAPLARRRDPLFDAIAVAWMGEGALTRRIPRQAGSRIAEARKQLAEIEAKPEEVTEFGRQWRQAKPSSECSPQAITGNWPTFISGELARQANGEARRRDETRDERHRRLAALMEQS